MPLYEYRCACGATEEKLQSFSAPESHACPTCGQAEGMRRQLSRSAFSLAGGGWHSQGYAAGSSAPAPKAESAESAPKPSTGGCAGGCACH